MSTTTRVTWPQATRPRWSRTLTVNMQPASLDLLQHGLGGHGGADGGGLEVIDLDAHADGGLTGARSRPSTAATVASSHERDDPRGGQDGHVARSGGRWRCHPRRPSA